VNGVRPGDNPAVGVLLAAGRGRRMGRTKQLIEIAAGSRRRPLVAAAYDAIAPACDRMIVVLGHEAEAVAAALGDRPFDRVDADPDAPMFESVRAGVRAAAELAARRVVLHPADHPRVAPTTLAKLAARADAEPARAIIPEHAGRGGHPVFIPASLFEAIAACAGEGGLRAFWRAQHAACARLPVEDPSVTRDLDEPSDLQS
jgi:molybdenum cofactor cytidylyltransferase